MTNSIDAGKQRVPLYLDAPGAGATTQNIAIFNDVYNAAKLAPHSPIAQRALSKARNQVAFQLQGHPVYAPNVKLARRKVPG